MIYFDLRQQRANISEDHVHLADPNFRYVGVLLHEMKTLFGFIYSFVDIVRINACHEMEDTFD